MGWTFDDHEVQDDIPGIGEHLASVARVDLGVSTKGDDMATIYFSGYDSGRLMCVDRIMLSGRGLGIGLKKLKELGAARHDDDQGRWHVDDVEEWHGLSVYLTIAHEEYNDRKQAKVDFNASGFGYRFHDPAEPEEPEPPPLDDGDIPF